MSENSNLPPDAPPAYRGRRVDPGLLVRLRCMRSGSFGGLCRYAATSRIGGQRCGRNPARPSIAGGVGPLSAEALAATALDQACVRDRVIAARSFGSAHAVPRAHFALLGWC